MDVLIQSKHTEFKLTQFDSPHFSLLTVCPTTRRNKNYPIYIRTNKIIDAPSLASPPLLYNSNAKPTCGTTSATSSFASPSSAAATHRT